MSKFVDLDLDRKTQLVLNFRVQSLMAEFISQRGEVPLEEVLKFFVDKSSDVFSLSESEINKHLEALDNQLEYCVRNETSTIIKAKLN